MDFEHIATLHFDGQKLAVGEFFDCRRVYGIAWSPGQQPRAFKTRHALRLNDCHFRHGNASLKS
jgi:hypothetical protein